MFLVQVWYDNRYRTVHSGSSEERARIMANKSYYTKYYTSIRIVETLEKIIYKWKRK